MPPTGASEALSSSPPRVGDAPTPALPSRGLVRGSREREAGGEAASLEGVVIAALVTLSSLLSSLKVRAGPSCESQKPHTSAFTQCLISVFGSSMSGTRQPSTGHVSPSSVHPRRSFCAMADEALETSVTKQSAV